MRNYRPGGFRVTTEGKMMKAATKKAEVNHAEQNAVAWYVTIREQVAALDCDFERRDELRELKDTGDADEFTSAERIELETLEDACGDFKDREDVEQRIQEGPLSVEVRSDWHEPGNGEDHNKPAEFCILLSTGAPALRITGDLDEYGQPSRAYLQYQDWGTPWTDYFPGSGSGEVLLTYCQQFYFGE